MKALITGASSGIGKSIAKYLDSLGYDTILVAREKAKLEALKDSLKNKSKIVVMDLTDLNALKSLYVLTKNEDINILVNNAGFGVFGEFDQIDLNKELDMMDVNMKAVHILTKLFLRDMKKRDSGYILNVSSSASFMPGPLMASYYASKAYVTRLTEAIAYELKRGHSNVRISCLCPGPVDTNFNRVAGVQFAVKPMNADDVSKYAIDQMLHGKMLIIPGIKMKLARFGCRFVSDSFIMKIACRIQEKKKA